jgi:hypothetical protein
MTYTFPLIHKYRFIIAILLAALVSTSMVAFKMVSPAQASPDASERIATNIVPVVYDAPHVPSSSANKAMRTLLGKEPITANGKLTFPRTSVSTTPAPKKEEPVVKKAEETKSEDAPAVADASAAAAPAKAQKQAKAQTTAPSAAPAQAAAPANNPVAAPVAAAPMAGTSPAAAQSFARSYLAGKGMGDSEFQCLVTLWNHESGWNFQASNPSSGAYGIPQSLPGSKMASVGADWQTNPQTQIIWGVGYITGRYGTPCGALAAWHVKGWY